MNTRQYQMSMCEVVRKARRISSRPGPVGGRASVHKVNRVDSHSEVFSTRGARGGEWQPHAGTAGSGGMAAQEAAEARQGGWCSAMLPTAQQLPAAAPQQARAGRWAGRRAHAMGHSLRDATPPPAPLSTHSTHSLRAAPGTSIYLLVWALHGHAPIKAAGAQQGGVQHVGAVGGGDADDGGRLVSVKPIKLCGPGEGGRRRGLCCWECSSPGGGGCWARAG